MSRGNFLRIFRIGLMLYLLAMVALGAWLSRSRSTDWDATLWVAVYPINADGSDISDDYIDRLRIEDFHDINDFVAGEARRYGVMVNEPVTMELAERVVEQPPATPVGGNAISIMWWSLQLRYWSWKVERSQARPAPDVQMFVRYHDPAITPTLTHSVGLQKGLVGVVNAYARGDMNRQNNVVVAHELLHTLGATDKYDVQTTLPGYPDGFADPDRDPLFPQRQAELMGGRIPISDSQADMPESLRQVVVGPATAREINWTN